ncbi:MAG: tRNA epoxyqueuosine(34) reductase QueG [Betaproteobacteria bacterium]|jgi:epoxyqueuosine reductase
MSDVHRPEGEGLQAESLLARVRQEARAQGFSQIGVSGIDLSTAEPGLSAWLAAGFHGSMGYMAAHGLKRARPAELVPGTVSVISVRMDYLPRRLSGAGGQADPQDWVAHEQARLADPTQAVVSVYARGRDYHKVLRQRLQKLAQAMAAWLGPFGHRAFTDSAPVLEVELAARSGLGWRGKHTLALHRQAGSMFFLGELFVDVALPPTPPVSAHCGQCSACLDVCPTQAIVAPYRLDARRCLSYLSIEHDGPIPLEFRRAMGNRVYGCDDCQLACPWNKYAQRAVLPDFDEREGLGDATLLALWAWDELTWLRRTEGSAIRRIGWARWRRNLAVALGNASAQGCDPSSAADLRTALGAGQADANALVREHIDWALAQAEP